MSSFNSNQPFRPSPSGALNALIVGAMAAGAGYYYYRYVRNRPGVTPGIPFDNAKPGAQIENAEPKLPQLEKSSDVNRAKHDFQKELKPGLKVQQPQPKK